MQRLRFRSRRDRTGLQWRYCCESGNSHSAFALLGWLGHAHMARFCVLARHDGLLTRAEGKRLVHFRITSVPESNVSSGSSYQTIGSHLQTYHRKISRTV